MLTSEWPPNYVEVYEWRQKQLLNLRADPKLLFGAFCYYRDHPAEFIDHWCDTYDPRKVAVDAPPRIPFKLFRRQVEFIQFLHLLLQNETSGLVEKCRDVGATYLCACFSVWLWLFRPGASVGWGSRKADLVDKLGDPDSIFEKMRMVIRALPRDFWPQGFNPSDHMSYMRIVNPENGATVTGESGDDIGRGGRKLIYFKDESAHYEHADSIEAALTDNTRIQMDISSVHGLGTVFERKRQAGVDWAPGQLVVKNKTNVFVFDWRDHPEKTQEWYEERRSKAEAEGMMHVFAQEVDRDYSAAMEGTVIPAAWVKSAVDAHVKLGVDDSGGWCAGQDIADEGGDTNALAVRKGIVLRHVSEWGQVDTGVSTRKAATTCAQFGHMDINYDCVGVGAGVKAEANRLVQDRLMPEGIRFVPWNAGGEVQDKERRFVPGDKQSPKNGDLFRNLKAQAWWNLRRRFDVTHRAVRSKANDATDEEKQFTWQPDQIISLDSRIPLLSKLIKELSQVTAAMASNLKLVVDKKPDGAKSPNLADATVACYFPARTMMKVTGPILGQARMVHVGRMGVKRPQLTPTGLGQ